MSRRAARMSANFVNHIRRDTARRCARLTVLFRRVVARPRRRPGTPTSIPEKFHPPSSTPPLRLVLDNSPSPPALSRSCNWSYADCTRVTSSSTALCADAPNDSVAPGLEGLEVDALSDGPDPTGRAMRTESSVASGARAYSRANNRRVCGCDESSANTASQAAIASSGNPSLANNFAAVRYSSTAWVRRPICRNRAASRRRASIFSGSSLSRVR